MTVTPSQTIGPFFGYALPTPDGPLIAPGDASSIIVRGAVWDGAGDPVPDALVEIWQAAADGSVPNAAGALRRDPVTGAFAGRTGIAFTGFGRAATDADGQWFVRTVRPGSRAEGAAPYLAVCVFARGLLQHLFTRIYLPDQAEALTRDTRLSVLPSHRLRTLLASQIDDGVFRFDIRLQAGAGPDDEETVFFEFQ